jgi:hypothetical protein
VVGLAVRGYCGIVFFFCHGGYDTRHAREKQWKSCAGGRTAISRLSACR